MLIFSYLWQAVVFFFFVKVFKFQLKFFQEALSSSKTVYDRVELNLTLRRKFLSCESLNLEIL